MMDKNRRSQRKFFDKVVRFFRKAISAKIAPYITINSWRIFLYRLCGYQLGEGVFIGMRCYLDDVEPKMLVVGKNVTISYGCFFACHGKNQPHTPIVIKEGAYLGMRANVVSGKTGVTIGRNAVIGACSLVFHDVPDNTTVAGIPAKPLNQKGESDV